MKTLRCVLAIVMVFSFIGCATTTFMHPTKTAQDFERDKYDCTQEAVRYADAMGASGNPLIISEQIDACMQAKYGWTIQK